MPIHTHTFDNGLVLVAEPMESVQSVAFSFLVPVGAAYDPSDRAGLSNLTCEMALRGCGDRDSRQFIEDLENLGVEGGEGVSISHSSYRGATLAENLMPTLSIYADVLRSPHLPVDQFEQGRQVAVQELLSVEDEPAHKVMMELRLCHYPDPWGRSHQGDMPGLQAMTIEDVRSHFSSGYRPNGTIVAVAGRIDWPELKDTVDQLLGDWTATDQVEPVESSSLVRRKHIDYQSNQTQIGIAFPLVPYRHPDYFQAWGAIGVLSDGSSSRLFTEVREKRGLCYAVSAAPRSLRQHGSVFCYAGSSADRAQETLNVMLRELARMADGIESVELDRLKARMKSSLIMAQESSLARSSAIARDWYFLGRVRTLEEVGDLVDALSAESINAFLAEHPPRDFTVVTLGPACLEIPDEFSA